MTAPNCALFPIENKRLKSQIFISWSKRHFYSKWKSQMLLQHLFRTSKNDKNNHFHNYFYFIFQFLWHFLTIIVHQIQFYPFTCQSCKHIGPDFGYLAARIWPEPSAGTVLTEKSDMFSLKFSLVYNDSITPIWTSASFKMAVQILWNIAVHQELTLPKTLSKNSYVLSCS